MADSKHPDFEGARQYALQRLERELADHLCYHSIAHTRDDVVPAARRLAEAEGITGETLTLLLTAAYFHDLGHIKQSDGHEAISIAIVRDALPGFGYTPEQIQVITNIIQATQMPQNPQTKIEQIMADADLDSLGRDDFIQTGNQLRAEMKATGQSFTDVEWYHHELSILQAHRYFTETARKLRDPGKQRNIAILHQLLAETEQPEA